MENATWSPALVEELLFRQFIKHEDVTSRLPPPPKASNENFMRKFDQSTKLLFAYVKNGPGAALASQNVNTTSVRHQSPTPMKPPAGRTPTSKNIVAETLRPLMRTPTPKLSRAPSVAKTMGSGSPLSSGPKRVKVEWPADVPTNQALKSNSRSKVAHLTAKRVMAQECVDPDLIFTQNPGELPLHVIFAQYPKALQSIAEVRSASGDWRNDTFTSEEERLYKKELGFTNLGPSQCAYGKPPLS